MSTAGTLAQATALLQSGRIDEALKQLTRITQTGAGNADAFGWLAIAYSRNREPERASQSIQRAIELSPANAGFYMTAANIQQDVGNLDAAVGLLQQAIRLNPAFAEAYNNLGIVLTDLRRIEEAHAAFRDAIRLKPQYARAYANLAAVQIRMLKFQDALTSAQRAASIQPDYAHAHHLAGSAFSLLGNPQAAEPELRTALRLKPDFSESSLLLARILNKLKRPTEAEVVIQQALTRSPQRAELWTFQGDMAAARDNLPDALQAYQRSLELRPNDLTTTIHAAMVLPSIYTSEAHLAACRERIRHGIDYLLSRWDALAQDLAPERFGDAMRNNFFLAYQGGNDVTLQRDYAEFMRSVAAKVMPDEIAPLPRNDATGRRIRVGFCSRFFYVSTAGNYFASWITDLDRSVFEVFVYHNHVTNDDLTARLRTASDHFVQSEESFVFFQKRLRADQLDILVYPEIGMDRVAFSLAALRLAPVQICGWGHPVTPGHKTIDYFLSCAAMEPPGAQAHYNERLLLLPGIGTRYERPHISATVKGKKRDNYELPEDRHLYLFPQSLFKIHPANDRLIVSVLANDENATLVMFAGQNQDITQRFVARLAIAFAEQGVSQQGRVKILPAVSHDDYKQINRLCDVMLDSLYWSGGNTSLDALAMGLPIVTLPGELMRGRQTMAMLKLLGLDELIANSNEDYLKIALRLATDKPYRQQISERIIANQAQLFDDPAPPRAFAQILEDLVRNPDSFATPQA